MFYFENDKTITVFFQDGTSAIWSKDNPNYKRVKALVEKENWIEVEILNNQNKAIITKDVIVTDDFLVKVKTEQGELELDNSSPLVKFINLLRKKGVIDKRIDEIKPFLKKMFQNIHIDAVTEIYDFCTKMDFEITKDGNFLAYKNVDKNLGSIFDKGITKHVIGEYTSVKNYCTDRSQTCSAGLHFCSKNYLRSYTGDVTIIVEIDPRDVVSIPRDYQFEKGRCCRYKTIGILGKDGDLSTTNIEKMTDNKVQIVKTKAQRKVDKKKAQHQAKVGNRIQETVSLMETHNGDVKKVAEIMNISVETVKRNMRKAKAGK